MLNYQVPQPNTVNAQHAVVSIVPNEDGATHLVTIQIFTLDPTTGAKGYSVLYRGEVSNEIALSATLRDEFINDTIHNNMTLINSVNTQSEQTEQTKQSKPIAKRTRRTKKASNTVSNI